MLVGRVEFAKELTMLLVDNKSIEQTTALIDRVVAHINNLRLFIIIVLQRLGYYINKRYTLIHQLIFLLWFHLRGGLLK